MVIGDVVMHLKQQYKLFSLICNISVCLSAVIYFIYLFYYENGTRVHKKRLRLVNICLWCCVLFQWLLVWTLSWMSRQLKTSLSVKKEL